MSLLFCDSFDHYATAQIFVKWPDPMLFGSGTPSVTIGATGRNSTNGAVPASWFHGFRKLFTAKATYVVGLALYLPSLPASAVHVVTLIDSATEQISLRLDAAGHLVVSRSGTTLATSVGTLTSAVYYYIEFKATIATSGSFEVRVNGTTFVSGSAVQTRTTANATADSVQIAGVDGVTGQPQFDDLYICDSLGTVNNDFLGDVRVQAVLPSGAGTTTAWTASAGANYTDVDEVTPNGDTDYVSSATLNQIDTYAMGNLTPTGGTIVGVQSCLYARKDDAGTRTIAPVLHIGSTDYVQANLPNLTTSYQYLPQVVELSPATSAAFTISEVNGLEFGQKVIA